MKISSIYLDLQKADKKKKNGKDVRVLESEAFKDPLNLQVVFDEDEKKYFDKKIEEQNKILTEMKWVLDDMRKERETFEQYKIRVEQESNEKDKLIAELEKQIIIADSENSELFAGIENLKKRIDWIDLDNENMVVKTEKIKEKLERETYLFKGSDFFSSSWISYLWRYEIMAWKYIEVIKTKIKEKNEYCTNEDSITFNIVSLPNVYLPQYELGWTTKLDTPTATIDYDIVLIPIQ